MSYEFVSNTPISRPVKLKDLSPDTDFNGVMWNVDQGFMYDPQDELLPITPPAPRGDT